MKDIYKCEVCGNIASLIKDMGVPLVCCGQQMVPIEPKSITQEDNEKHVPMVEKTPTGVKVKVGSVLHPMEEDHFIEFIQIQIEDKVLTKSFQPGDEPVLDLCCAPDATVVALAYCNKHGLWQNS